MINFTVNYPLKLYLASTLAPLSRKGPLINAMPRYIFLNLVCISIFLWEALYSWDWSLKMLSIFLAGIFFFYYYYEGIYFQKRKYPHKKNLQLKTKRGKIFIEINLSNPKNHKKCWNVSEIFFKICYMELTLGTCVNEVSYFSGLFVIRILFYTNASQF